MKFAGPAGEDPALAAKRKVAERGAAEVRDGMVLALGTGSTTALCLEILGQRIREEGLRLRGVPTSFSAAENGRRAGIQVCTLADVERVDLALDGADEVDPDRNLIKGGGAAHTQEKVVDGAAARFLVLVDESKLVKRLGETFAVPIEVLPFALRPVQARLAELGAEVEVRRGSGKDGPVVSDHGNLILDARFAPLEDPAATATALDGIAGVVAHGIFVGLADEILIGGKDGSVRSL